MSGVIFALSRVWSRRRVGTFTRMKPALVAATLCFALSIACSKEPTRWDTDASAATLPAASVPKTEGAKLNAFFPKDADGYTRTFTQEKDGFVEAKVKKDGKEEATLTVSDANGDDAVKSKFEKATEKLGDSPLVTVGKNQSAVLVGKRYQVKVTSTTLDEAARKAWLGKFDLAGLSKL